MELRNDFNGQDIVTLSSSHPANESCSVVTAATASSSSTDSSHTSTPATAPSTLSQQLCSTSVPSFASSQAPLASSLSPPSACVPPPTNGTSNDGHALRLQSHRPTNAMNAISASSFSSSTLSQTLISTVPAASSSSSSSSSSMAMHVQAVSTSHGLKRTFGAIEGEPDPDVQSESVPATSSSHPAPSTVSAQSSTDAADDVMEIVDPKHDHSRHLPSASSSSSSSASFSSSSFSSSSIKVKSEGQSSTSHSAADSDDSVQVLDKGTQYVSQVWKKDPHYDYRQDYSVAIVTRGDGDEWLDMPSVLDDGGKKIFIGRSGASFGIRVARNNYSSRRPLVRVLIDGRDIGYYHYFGSQETEYIFKGFQSDGNFSSYHSFVFASTMPLDEKPKLIKKEEPDVVRGIGSIVCKFFDYEYQALPTHAKVQNVSANPTAAQIAALAAMYQGAQSPLPAAAQAPFIHQMRRAATVSKGHRDDGVKFWQRPGLSTSSSSTIAIRCHSEQGRGRAVQKEALCVVEHRYDSAEYLELRGLLSRDNPAHAEYLRAHEPVSQQRRDAFSSALVKLEKVDDGQIIQHVQRVKVKKEKSTEEVCDLTAEDGEEKWSARKKMKHTNYELLEPNENEQTER